MATAIKVITFDLWDTLVADESDEPKRSEAGLPSKHDQRRCLIWQAVNEVEPMQRDVVELAYNVTDAAFNQVWKKNHITWSVADRVAVTLNGLGVSLPDDTFFRLVEELEIMEVQIYPDIIADCKEILQGLAKQYKLAIVSDAIVTPGVYLRDLLDKHGVKQFFSAFAFSDEVGHSKPHRDMFATIANQLGVHFDEMVHIGDRDHNDIKGPHALGMEAVLFTATRDVDAKITSADAVCSSYRDLPTIIEKL